MIKKSFLEPLKNKRGAALTTVLVVFFTLVIIVTSATMLTQSNLKQTVQTSHHASAFFIAETGLKETLDEFETFFEEQTITTGLEDQFAQDFMNEVSNSNGEKIVIKYEPVMGQLTRADVTLTYNSSGFFELRSTGTVGSTTRTVLTEITIQHDSKTLRTSSSSLDPSQLEFATLPARPNYEDAFPHGKELDAPVMANNRLEQIDRQNNFTANAEWDLNLYKMIPDLANDQSERSYNSITIRGNSGTVQIDVGDHDLTIITRSLLIDGLVEIIGRGSLTIYVIGENGVITSDNLKVTPAEVNTRDTIDGSLTNDFTKLSVVVYETTDGNGNGLTISPAGWTRSIYMSIFSDNLNYSGQDDFRGVFVSIYGTSFSVNGGGQLNNMFILFAPNATLTLGHGNKVVSGIITVKDKVDPGGGIRETKDLNTSFNTTLIEEVFGLRPPTTPTEPTPPVIDTQGKLVISPMREV